MAKPTGTSAWHESELRPASYSPTPRMEEAPGECPTGSSRPGGRTGSPGRSRTMQPGPRKPSPTTRETDSIPSTQPPQTDPTAAARHGAGMMNEAAFVEAIVAEPDDDAH